MSKHAIVFEEAGLTRRELRARRRELRAALSVAEEGVSREEAELPAPAVPGRFGPGLLDGGYWNPVRLRVAPHESTSRHLAGIYPFVADTSIGHKGPLLGVDLNADALFHFSPWDSYADESERKTLSTNILVAGGFGSGKSSTIKQLVTRSLAYDCQVVVPSDSKAEWVPVAEACKGLVIRIGGGSAARLNPLDRGPRRTGSTEEEDEREVSERRSSILQSLVEQTARKSLTAGELVAIEEALRRACHATGDRPTLRAVYLQLEQMSAERSDLAAAAKDSRYVLRRFVDGDLAGLFEDESTVQFDDSAPMVVVDTSELFKRSDLVAQLVSTCTTAWIQAVISDKDARRRRYIVREEGWRDLASVAQLRMFEQWLKLSRDYGISNIIIIHKLRDLEDVGAEGSEERALAHRILGDIENFFLFRVNRQELEHFRSRLPGVDVDLTARLNKGVFLAVIGKFSYLIDAFATSTSWERALFLTDAAITSDDLSVDAELLEAVWPEPVDDSVAGWLDALNGGIR